MNPHCVVATLQCVPEAASEVKSALLTLVTPSRADLGCLRYELHECQQVPGKFIFVEQWSSPEHLQLHLGQPHVTSVLSAIQPLLISVQIDELNQISH